MGGHIFGRAIYWEGMGGHPCTNTILSASSTSLASDPTNASDTVSVLGREEGYTVKYTPLLMEFPRAKLKGTPEGISRVES